jgi:hypothetical protein
MVRTSMRPLSLRITAVALVVVLSLVWTAVAQAQSPDDRSADVQYKRLGPPSGPVAEVTPEVTPEGALLIEGEICVVPGASVTVEDADGTRGTYIDGEGASITPADNGVSVSGNPQIVTGGDQALDTATAVVVASTGISEECDERAWVGGVLPDTAGAPLILLALGGVLVIAGTATAFLRRPSQR